MSRYRTQRSSVQRTIDATLRSMESGSDLKYLIIFSITRPAIIKCQYFRSDSPCLATTDWMQRREFAGQCRSEFKQLP